MGRFSPTVAPIANDGLANALGNFTETFAQFASRRRQRDLDAVETGIGLTPADASTPQGAPSGPIASLRARLTGRTNPNDIANAIRNAAPAVQGANAVSSGIGEALSRGESYTPDTSGVPQLPSQMRLPSGQVISTAMTPIGQRLAQQRLAAIGMGSEIGLRNSEIAKNTREASTPRLGDPGYADAVAGVEGAKAQATLGPELQKLVASGAISRETALAVASVTQAGENARQDRQQTFTAGENTKNREQTATNEQTRLSGDLSNRVAGIQETQRGEILPSLIRGVKTITGHGDKAPNAPLKQIITPSERDQLKALGHSDADIAANYVVKNGR